MLGLCRRPLPQRAWPQATHTPLSAYGKASAGVAPGFPAQATRLHLAKLPSTEKYSAGALETLF